MIGLELYFGLECAERAPLDSDQQAMGWDGTDTLCVSSNIGQCRRLFEG